MAALTLHAAAGGPAVWRLEVADSWLRRLRGLIGRRQLAPGEGLYLPGTNSLHMLFMRFPIDCVFIGHPDRDGWRSVVGTRRDLRPWTGVVWWVSGAAGAIEVPAGSIDAAGIRIGDRVRLQPAGVEWSRSRA